MSMRTKASETKWIIDHGRWDDDEFAVTVRPDWEKPWSDLPIGKTLSRQEAFIVVDWLQTAMPALMKIAENMSREESS